MRLLSLVMFALLTPLAVMLFTVIFALPSAQAPAPLPTTVTAPLHPEVAHKTNDARHYASIIFPTLIVSMLAMLFSLQKSQKKTSQKKAPYSWFGATFFTSSLVGSTMLIANNIFSNTITETFLSDRQKLKPFLEKLINQFFDTYAQYQLITNIAFFLFAALLLTFALLSQQSMTKKPLPTKKIRK